MKPVLLIISLCLFFLMGCGYDFGFRSNSKDPIVVKVGTRSLFKSQLDGLVHDGISRADSAAIVDGYVQNWIRENLMILEAEQNVAADINLNKLVDDYRSSLLVYNYEKRLVEKQLDTIVLDAETREYYHINKNQFVLSHSILKCIVAKIPAKLPGVNNIKDALAKKDLTEAMFLIKEKAVFHHLDTAKWMSREDLIALLPQDLWAKEEIIKDKVYKIEFKDAYYFIKILKYYKENEIPPYDYIKDKIEKTILGNRKVKLLIDIRQKLYDKGVAEKQFEIFKMN